MHTYQSFKVQQTEDILTVTLNDAKSANAVDIKMIKELILLADWLREESSIKFVVFTNKGSLFSSGANLYEVHANLQDESKLSEHFRRMQVIGQEMIRKLESIEQITIAAMRGSAYGAGVALALTTDYRYMTESSVFNLPETNVGLFLTWGCTPKLVKSVGALKAKELIMLGEDISAEECCRLGLINGVISEDEMGNNVERIIDKIKSKGQMSIRLTKKLINASVASNFGDLTINEPELVESVIISGETKAKVQEFIDKKGNR